MSYKNVNGLKSSKTLQTTKHDNHKYAFNRLHAIPNISFIVYFFKHIVRPT